MYIKGNRTFVNLDRAEHVELVGSRGGQALKFTTERNRELGITGEIDLEYLTSPLVPGSAVMIAINTAGQTTAHPVAAYRVLRAGAAEPVFTVEPSEGAVLFQAIGAHGVARLADGTIFPDLATARNSVTGAAAPDGGRSQAPIEPEQPRGKRHAR
jgi:hypothetical protein